MDRTDGTSWKGSAALRQAFSFDGGYYVMGTTKVPIGVMVLRYRRRATTFTIAPTIPYSWRMNVDLKIPGICTGLRDYRFHP